MPCTPDGSSTPIVVGGDRLTEANSRNVQWAFANGATESIRLEDLQFIFLDWHAVRNMYEVSGWQKGHECVHAFIFVLQVRVGQVVLTSSTRCDPGSTNMYFYLL